MTPIQNLDNESLQQRTHAAVLKAKEALTECVLLGLADATGNLEYANSPVLAQSIEDATGGMLRTTLPLMVDEIQNPMSPEEARASRDYIAGRAAHRPALQSLHEHLQAHCEAIAEPECPNLRCEKGRVFDGFLGGSEPCGNERCPA